MARPQPTYYHRKPSVYDGEKPEEFGPWLSKFRETARVQNWGPEPEVLENVPLYLTGVAFEAHGTIPPDERATWDDLRTTMNAALGIGENALQWKLQFQNTSRKAGESINSFVRRLRGLVRRGFPNLQAADEIREKVNEQFIMGSNRDLKFHLLTLGEDRLLAQNITAAKTFEMADNISKTSRATHLAKARNPILFEDAEPGSREAAIVHTAAAKATKGGGWPQRDAIAPPRVAQCYRCGQTDHLARECRNQLKPAAVPTGSECYNCGREGHVSRFCPERRVGSPDLPTTPARQDHPDTYGTTKSVCRRCGNLNHAAERCYTDMDKSCQQCGKRGHLAAGCRGGMSIVRYRRALLAQAPQTSKNGTTLALEEEV